MYRRSVSLVLLGFILMLQVATPVMANDWELVYKADNLRVSKRDYAGSALDEIKGVVRVKTSLNAVMALLKDAPFNQHWVFRSSGARILKESGYAQAYVYGVVDAPLPMSDRDTVVRFDYQQNPQTKDIKVTITNFPDFIAPVAEHVRVPVMGGYWGLKPEPGGWVEVTYQIHGDPGGRIPAWLANQAALLSVRHTLENLAAVVHRYEKVRSEFVVELE